MTNETVFARRHCAFGRINVRVAVRVHESMRVRLQRRFPPYNAPPGSLPPAKITAEFTGPDNLSIDLSEFGPSDIRREIDAGWAFVDSQLRLDAVDRIVPLPLPGVRLTLHNPAVWTMQFTARRPTIVHLINALDHGGTESMLVRLLCRFRHESTRHTVVTMRSAGTLARRLPSEVGCQNLGICGTSRTAWLRIAQILERNGAAVLHARNTGCWGDALAAATTMPRMRVVLGFHGLDHADGFTSKMRRLTWWAVRCGARFATVSEAGRTQLITQGRIPVSRIMVLPNGIEHARFDNTAVPADQTALDLRTSLDCAHDSIVIGSVGSLTAVKGYAALIDAVAECVGRENRIVLWLVGDGPQRSDLESQVARLGIRNHVRFLGHRQDIPTCLQAMNAYVCSSRSECMSNALLEALAAGVPVVATDVGGNRELLRHGAGLLTERVSAPDIARCIMHIVDSPAHAAGLATAGRRAAACYGMDRSVVAYESFYNDLLCRRQEELTGAAATIARHKTGVDLAAGLQFHPRHYDRELADVLARGLCSTHR